MDTAYRRPLARAFVRRLCSHSATDPFLLLFFSQEKQSLGGRERVGRRRRRRSEPERTRRRREWSGVNVDVNVRAKNGRYWISARLVSRRRRGTADGQTGRSQPRPTRWAADYAAILGQKQETFHLERTREKKRGRMMDGSGHLMRTI